MNEFYIGAKVTVKTFIDGHYEYEKGIIIKLFSDIDMAVVDMENGDIRKAYFDQLELDKEEPVEKTGVLIDRAEFQKIAYDLGIEEAGDDLQLVYRLGRFAGKLQEVLFSDRSIDD